MKKGRLEGNCIALVVVSLVLLISPTLAILASWRFRPDPYPTIFA